MQASPILCHPSTADKILAGGHCKYIVLAHWLVISSAVVRKLRLSFGVVQSLLR